MSNNLKTIQTAYKANTRPRHRNGGRLNQKRFDKPHYTSRICHHCGWDSGKKPLDIREWTCPHCHETHDRDINAAINILYRGLETYLQSQLMLLNEQAKNGYFTTVFFQVALQWLKQTITYFNQALEIT